MTATTGGIELGNVKNCKIYTVRFTQAENTIY